MKRQRVYQINLYLRANTESHLLKLTISYTIKSLKMMTPEYLTIEPICMRSHILQQHSKQKVNKTSKTLLKLLLNHRYVFTKF